MIVVLTILCALSYAAFEIFASLTGNKINSWLAAALFNGIGTVVPLIVYFSLSSKGKTSITGFVFASLAGIAIMTFSVLLARIFSLGGTLSFVIPVIYGGAIVLSSLFGWLVLKDKVSSLQALGIGLIAIGVVTIVLSKQRIS